MRLYKTNLDYSLELMKLTHYQSGDDRIIEGLILITYDIEVPEPDDAMNINRELISLKERMIVKKEF